MRAFIFLGCSIVSAGCGLEMSGLGSGASDGGGVAGDEPAIDQTDGADESSTATDSSTADEPSAVDTVDAAVSISEWDARADARAQLDAADATVSHDAGAAIDDASDSAAIGDSYDASCVSAIPSGWSVAIYDLGPDACPANFTAHGVFGPPIIGSGACSCTCAVTQPGTCTDGTLDIALGHGGANATCGTAVFSGAVSAAACTPAVFSPNATTTMMSRLQVSPLAPQGGACSGALLADPMQLSAPSALYCDVPAASAEAVCSGTVPSGFAACIAKAGTDSCPASTPFVNRYSVEDGAALQCSDCAACTVATTCSGATLSLFGNGLGRALCLSPLLATVAADGNCNGLGMLPNVAAIRYTANASSTCTPAPAIASAQLTNPATICCR